MDKLGIVAGDIVTTVNGKKVSTPASLTAIVVTKSPGDTVQVRWTDQYGTPHVASLQLATGPPQGSRPLFTPEAWLQARRDSRPSGLSSRDPCQSRIVTFGSCSKLSTSERTAQFTSHRMKTVPT